MIHLSLLLSLISCLLLSVQAQLGISGNQGTVCSQACTISQACHNDCYKLPADDYGEEYSNSTFYRCLCQDACVDFTDVCLSCCDAALATRTNTAGPYCLVDNVADISDCQFFAGIVADREANIFRSISFTSSASLPAAQASYVSALRSPRLVALTLSTGSGSTAIEVATSLGSAASQTGSAAVALTSTAQQASAASTTSTRASSQTSSSSSGSATASVATLGSASQHGIVIHETLLGLFLAYFGLWL